MPTKKILITKEGRKFYVEKTSQDFHSQYGVVKKEFIENAKDGELLKSNTGKDFFIFTASFIDAYRRIKRGAQIVMPKDIGMIITETGINRESRILDAGSGSGSLACFLASIAKEVITYDIREDFIEIVKSNIEFLGLRNIKIKKKDLYAEMEEDEIDVVTLDLPEPWNAIDNCSLALKTGGFIVSYSPSIPQVCDFVAAIRKNDNFVYLKTVEIIEREWEIEERKVRPKSRGVGHSGFLSFARKIR